MDSGENRLLLRAFCTQFRELCSDLDLIFNDDVDVRTATTGIRAMLAANPKMLAKVFCRYVAEPYGESFAKGDTEFFLNKDYSTDIKLKNAPSVIDKINGLRTPVSQMSEECHAKVMKYFANMSKLTMLIFGDKAGLNSVECT